MTDGVPVGIPGFKWDDGSKQTSAGQQPVDDRTFFISEGGDNTNSGATLELPLRTIMLGVDDAALKTTPLVPLVVKIAKGTYDEEVVGVPFVDLEGMGAAILNTTAGVTALKGATSQQNQLGFVGSFADNSIAYEIDGIARNLLAVSTMSLGSPLTVNDNITGIKIAGTNDDIQIRALSVNNRATNSTGVNITGTSETAITLTLGNITNFANGFTGIDCNSSDILQIVNVNFDNFKNGNGGTPTGVVFCTGTSGKVTLRGENAVMPGETFVSAGTDLSVDISMSQVFGDVEALDGGTISFSRFGFLFGDLTVETGGEAFGNILRVTGDITIESGAIFDGIIGKVIGTVNIDPAAAVDGIINGVAYGTYATSFAQFFVENNGSTTTINTLGVYEDINCLLTRGIFKDFTVSGNTITYTGVPPINVEITWEVTAVDVVDQRDEVLIKAHKNGTTALNGRGRVKNSPITPPDHKLTMSVSHATSLVQNDTIDLKGANGSDTSNINFFEITGTIRQIK